MTLPSPQAREPAGDLARVDRNGRRWLECEIRAREYDAKSREAVALAEASTLDRVREQHLLSAAAWMQMAEQEERLAEASIRRLAAVAARRVPDRRGLGLEEDVICTA
jgi:hypothetical protein